MSDGAPVMLLSHDEGTIALRALHALRNAPALPIGDIARQPAYDGTVRSADHERSHEGGDVNAGLAQSLEHSPARGEVGRSASGQPAPRRAWTLFTLPDGSEGALAFSIPCVRTLHRTCTDRQCDCRCHGRNQEGT